MATMDLQRPRFPLTVSVVFNHPKELSGGGSTDTVRLGIRSPCTDKSSQFKNNPGIEVVLYNLLKTIRYILINISYTQIPSSCWNRTQPGSTGLIQGLILLFLMHFKDFPASIKLHCDIFVDDVKLNCFKNYFREIWYLENGGEIQRTDLRRASDWRAPDSSPDWGSLWFLVTGWRKTEAKMAQSEMYRTQVIPKN